MNKDKKNRYAIDKIESEILKILRDKLNIAREATAEIKAIITPPKISGDLSITRYNLTEYFNLKPEEIVKNIETAFNESESEWIEKTTAIILGKITFINFKLKKEKLYKEIIFHIASLGNNYGKTGSNAGKSALIDFSSPNIAKPMSVGHLRSTIIGQALANIYEATGYKVIRENYLGDWGVQFGKLIYAYKKWGDGKELKKNPIQTLKNLYVKFHKESEKNPEIENEAKKIFNELERGDKEYLELWKKFKKLSVDDFKKTYEKLKIKFDHYASESDLLDKLNEVARDCEKKKICQKDPESMALIVDFQKDEMPSFLLRRQDGSSLYHTRDLAALKFRIKKYKPNDILYVVGQEQSLYFKQLFFLAEKMGYLGKTNIKHIDFGMVLTGGKKMSTREGTVIELEELIDQSMVKSRKIIEEKNPGLSKTKINNISKIVGIGAIIYNDLRQSREKNISFNWDKMLDWKGQSAAYLQYTFVRINSILTKIGGEIKNGGLDENNIIFEKESEINLAKKLMYFSIIIKDAQTKNAPHLIAVYLEELAQIFNNFYNETSIINTENKELKQSRFMLIKVVAQVIKNGLSFFNIDVPEKM